MSLADVLENLPPAQQRLRRREWNRQPLQDYFPRMPEHVLERVLDKLIDKNIIYYLGNSKFHNQKRFTSIVVAHARHEHSDYDRLLRAQHMERFDARQATGSAVWKVLRQWCPWNASNEALQRCFDATLIRPADRGDDFDLMDIDEDSDDAGDPMDLD